MALLTVNLLGRFQVKLADKEINGFSTDKTRALLAYLAVESDRSHRRQALAGLLWPDFSESSARSSLRSALVNLRQIIGDHNAEPPFLLISRQSIGINPDGDIRVDATSFSSMLDIHHISRLSISQLEEAVNLYKGKFLEGFSLPDSAPFDDWVLIKREQLNIRMLAALDRLSAIYGELGDYQKAVFFAKRQVELEPWEEPAQRRLIQLLAESGHRPDALAQYEDFQRLLAEELDVEPEIATKKLYQEIREGSVHEVPLTSALSADITSTLPSFQIEDIEVEVDNPPFVGREYELHSLHSHFKEVMGGQGKVIFVVGGAGRGKTFLLREFARQVLSKHSFPIAEGYCNAYSGGGDPFLPFRQVLDMLTGDVDEMWAAGMITKRHAKILWETLSIAAEAIVEVGPDLIETLLSGPALVNRAAATAGIDAAWLPRLNRIVNAKITSRVPADLEQNTLIDQYTRVLEYAARQAPLIILLEDFHWADRGSINLLFNIGRHLSASRVLIICAFRPDELAARSDGDLHPINDLVNEVISFQGDSVIDLARAEKAASQQFVDDLLDTEPNQYSKDFRRALYHRTQGHPLFTVEMLHMLKEQGSLIRDSQNRWIEGELLDWDNVPARIEAVIQKRVDRLDPWMYEMLTVASVQGEDFSAEIISRVLNLPELQVLHALSQDLGKRYRLLQDTIEYKTGGQPVSRFRFSHQLIQWYVYSNLSTAERRLLHEAVAKAMEDLFTAEIDTVTIPLAYHYSLTGVKDKTLHYLTQAGHQAQKRYDAQQAVYYFTNALSIETGNTPTRFNLLAARSAVYGVLAQREAQKADIDAMQELAADIEDKKLQCDALLALADFYLATEIFRAREPAQKARLIAQEIGDSVREAHALRRLSWEGRLGADFQTSRVYLKEAASLFRDAGLPGEAAECLFMLARRLPLSAKHVFELTFAEEAMTLSHKSGDYHLQAIARKNLAVAYTNLGKDAQALPVAKEALAMQSDLGDLHEQASSLDVLGVVLARLGRPKEAAVMFHRCLTFSEEIGSDWGILGAVFGFWNYCCVPEGDYAQFIDFIDVRLNYALENERDWLSGFLSWMKTLCLNDIGQYEQALALTRTTSYQVTEEDLVSKEFVTQLAGAIKGNLGRYNEARQDLEVAHELAQETSDPYMLCFPLTDLAKLALQEGKQNLFHRALEQAESAVKITSDLNEERGLAEALDVSARLYLALGLSQEAFNHSSQALRLLESNPWLPKPQNHLYTHFLVLRSLGDQIEASDYLLRAYDRVMFVAGKFTDKPLRRGWLQNIEVNYEIVRLAEEILSD